MPQGAPTNAVLAAALHEYAALLELAGAESYAARAFRRGADLIAASPVPVADLVRSGRVRELRGVGPGIEARLRELVETGQLAEVEELRREASPELAALGRMLGFGARRGAQIGAALGISTLAELREAAAAGRLQEVPGIGPQTEAAIRAAIAGARPESSRSMRLDQALALSARIAETLDGIPAGDARRYREDPRRLAVVVPTRDPVEARAQFASHPDVVAVLEHDVGVTTDGFPIELHLAPPERLGSVLVEATGSREYVASLGPLPDACDEAGVFRLLGLPHLPPELRELPAAAAPDDLLTLERIRGDLTATPLHPTVARPSARWPRRH